MKKSVYLAARLVIQVLQSLTNIMNITLVKAKGESAVVVANFNAFCQ